jgi:hemolysin III
MNASQRLLVRESPSPPPTAILRSLVRCSAGYSQPLSEFLSTVEEIEQLTGLNFGEEVPDADTRYGEESPLPIAQDEELPLFFMPTSRPTDSLAPTTHSIRMRPGERFNTCTHLFGFALAVLGVPLMLTASLPTGNVGKIVGGLVFALSCVALYAASTFFHGSHGQAKLWWQRADHCAIYLLIAGSYTPFALVAVQGAWDWTLLVAVWSIALLGIARELGVASPKPPLHSTLEWAGSWWLLPYRCLPRSTREGYSGCSSGQSSTQLARSSTSIALAIAMHMEFGTCLYWVERRATMQRLSESWPELSASGVGANRTHWANDRCVEETANAPVQVW